MVPAETAIAVAKTKHWEPKVQEQEVEEDIIVVEEESGPVVEVDLYNSRKAKATWREKRKWFFYIRMEDKKEEYNNGFDDSSLWFEFGWGYPYVGMGLSAGWGFLFILLE